MQVPPADKEPQAYSSALDRPEWARTLFDGKEASGGGHMRMKRLVVVLLTASLLRLRLRLRLVPR
jgi:hypothetical protein